MTHGSDPEGGAYRWALRMSVVAVGIVGVVGVVVAGITRGTPGLWGALAGALLGALSGVVTPAAMIAGYRKKPEVFAGIVAGSWLGKMLVIVVGLAIMGRIESVDRVSLAAVVLACVASSLAIDLVAVRKARIPYVDARSEGPTS